MAWIETQDKNRIIEINGLEIIEYTSNRTTICDTNGKVLGIYKTIEKAKKVLNMFKYYIAKCEKRKFLGYKYNEDIDIFTMPLDSEV